jgi:hypothetical protein
MPNNTKARSQEILSAAHSILDEQNVDITEGVEILPLAKILEPRVRCHIDTAKKAIAKAVRQKRGQLVAEWGGAREGAGYPKGQPRKPKAG